MIISITASRARGIKNEANQRFAKSRPDRGRGISSKYKKHTGGSSLITKCKTCAATRREFNGIALSGVFSILHTGSVEAFEDGKQVSAYLPASVDVSGYFVFEAGQTRTPALRAGAIEPYKISLPGDWKEIPVSNAKSGNYCQPRCDEATTEVQFASPTAGTLQVIIIPTNKLMITEKSPEIESVGTLDSVLNAVSPAITGSVAVEQEEIISQEQYSKNNRGYYQYELLTPFAAYGLHNLACVTTSQNYVVIATVAASEKQWSTSEQELRNVVTSFQISKVSQKAQ
ncbi:thylakoid lumenal 20 kDa protein, putative [Ostreococcus lucimarinus CCE9901]|uniref:Thylakoid lumenal 20 kDa protein, putative n=1 Tax=Ostreococcus lucimarinus (strain CCE9901) TaxID=436017 RepID=A4RST3_OSTLU|nr:thylakoid lumenal 20 kDa protein, putative [Ostreococcus lucimarinus CCE9901]ABO94730.1 thylakoid lumenal 20 kDa protein, putative [Ostreococcus lucimarinus CCE9901]|eukprot:XP_001416437.1 thylakoid lumenal 20 kDa protein, putative [Ostreococcus lucimarinus CCE9901]